MDKTNKKYELIDDDFDFISSRKVYRIKALRDFGSVVKSDIGGYVECEENLSHLGNCWIYDDAHVFDKARVYDDASVCMNAWVFDDAEVFGNANVHGDARVYQYAKVFGNARVGDQAKVYNSAEVFDNAIVHGNARVKGVSKVSKPVTVIDNSKVIITITDNHIHVYQSSLYKKENIPDEYLGILNIIDCIKK